MAEILQSDINKKICSFTTCDIQGKSTYQRHKRQSSGVWTEGLKHLASKPSANNEPRHKIIYYQCSLDEVALHKWHFMRSTYQGTFQIEHLCWASFPILGSLETKCSYGGEAFALDQWHNSYDYVRNEHILNRSKVVQSVQKKWFLCIGVLKLWKFPSLSKLDLDH